jgi:beta-glucosidase
MGDHGKVMSPDPLATEPIASAELRGQPHIGVLDAAISSGKQVILVILSGRPLVMEPSVVSACDAIVAAWLPGSSGRGVADVLYGEADFSGTLSHTWPASFDQIPINVDKAGDEPGLDAGGASPLYPYGHGLTYPL